MTFRRPRFEPRNLEGIGVLKTRTSQAAQRARRGLAAPPKDLGSGALAEEGASSTTQALPKRDVFADRSVGATTSLCGLARFSMGLQLLCRAIAVFAQVMYFGPPELRP